MDAPTPDDDAPFPPVSWDEIEEHLIGHLYIDDEWMSRGPQSLTWWPWFLEQNFRVTASGTWDDENPDDNYVTVLASTPIVSCDEATGRTLCEEARYDFPLGSFVWEEGVLALVTSLSLNPKCRGLLSLFHEAALAQALAAHVCAGAWDERDDVDIEVLASAHPTSGPREEADELLRLFAGDGRSDGWARIPDGDALLARGRRTALETLSSMGWTVARSEDAFDMLTAPRGTLMIGLMTGSDDEGRYGQGLGLVVPLTAPDHSFTEAEVNNCALAMTEHPVTSLLGSIRTDSRQDGYGTHLFVYLTSGYLAANRFADRDIGIAIVNAALHACSAVSMFWQEVEASQGQREQR